VKSSKFKTAAKT